MSDTNNRAKISILSELLSLPTIRGKDWHSTYREDVKVGDLVAMSSAPASKWYLSWLHEIEIKESGSNRYLLESVEDGALCWWENIGMDYYDRERLGERVRWRWSDKQFKFNDRWYKVCRRNDAYTILPCDSTFSEDGSVILKVRARHDFGPIPHNEMKFTEWNKTTMAMMEKFYLAAVESMK